LGEKIIFYDLWQKLIESIYEEDPISFSVGIPDYPTCPILHNLEGAFLTSSVVVSRVM